MANTNQEQDSDSQQEFRTFLSQHQVARERYSQRVQERQQTRRKKESNAREVYRKWKGQKKRQQERGARQILRWVQQFLLSNTYKEILALRGRRRNHPGDLYSLTISSIVTYERPTSWGGTQTWSQRLLLGMNGQLYVREVVKYGRSTPIRTVEEVLQYVDPPVILQTAQEMESGDVWKLIQEGLAAELRYLQKDLRDMEDDELEELEDEEDED